MKHSPGFLRLVEEARSKVGEVGVAEVRARVERGDSFHFIDVREDHEWEMSRCRGARHLARGILERDIESLVPDAGAEIILYCGGGFRSVLAAESLQKMGYSRVRSMAGGFRAWTQAGAPTVGPRAKAPLRRMEKP